MDELIKIAKQFNIFDKNTLKYLKSNQDDNNLLNEQIHAKELGVKAVPCFIINKQYVLMGAQDKNSFQQIFDIIINDN